MRQNRFVHALLAAAMTVSLTLPASAAGGSSFSDVTDSATALNADVLRLMGVVSGTGGNQFNPGQVLTRAQFCTMVVNFMGKRDDVVLHSTRTIFTDVDSTHWARGYVNLAASTTIGGSKEQAGSPLISGVGDGRFLPDQQITLDQAVTILIRVLGYSGGQVGAVWPDGYMNLAKSIGLTDGLSLSAGSALNRAQAAQLFVNALTCKTGAGQVYYTTLGQAKENIVLLAVNTETDDGSALGAVRTSEGTYLPSAEDVAPSALVGHMGSLVLNDKSEIITFVPDESENVTITLSGQAEASYVTALGNKRYTISGDTPVYTSSSSEKKPYSEAFSSLPSGSQITLFIQRGKVVAIFSGAAATGSSTDAVVVTGSVSDAAFHKLTGGVTGYTIKKNQQTISLSDIKPYDVVTYDAMANTLIVSDLRLTCTYEDAAPNSKAPQTITVLGHTFPVLESAWNDTAKFSLGQQVTLLLTADGKVAGMAQASGQTQSNAYGMATSETEVLMFLPNGGTLKLTGKASGSGTTQIAGQVVAISGSSNRLYLSRFNSKQASGTFDPAKMTVGTAPVSPGVKIFERVGDSEQVEISINSLKGMTIPENKIFASHTNSSGTADIIVLQEVTGDAYTYGKLKESWENENGPDKGNRSVTVENGTGGLSSLLTGLSFKDGSFGGVVKSTIRTPIGTGSYQPDKASSIITLTEIKNVRPSDFFQTETGTYITVQGKTYQVSDKVECYKSASKTWFTQESGQARLNACKAFSSDLTIYVDPIGSKVRVVSAN